MIFYYSATGNSKWIAQKAAEAIGDEAVNILGKDPRSYSFSEKDTVGFVWPVFSCIAPETMIKFAGGIRPNGAYTFSICNYSNFCDLANECFARDAMIPIDSHFGLIMPDNTTVIGSKYDTEETTVERLRTAEERLSPILEKIKSREKGVFETEVRGPGNGEFSRTLPPSFWRYRSFTSRFYVEKDKCISCGLCEKNCPVQAIELRDGYPVWVKERCEVCSACINRCPKEAIEFGNVSQDAYRYTFEKYYKKI